MSSSQSVASGALPAATSTSVPISAAVSASSPSFAALPLKRDTDEGPALAGIGLLLALLVGAAVLIVAGRRHGRTGSGRFAPWLKRWGAVTHESQGPRSLGSLRLDPTTRLHTIEWHGEVILLATASTHPPVVVARRHETGAGETAQ